MLILILIDVQYLQNAVFSFEKGSNHQNHSSSGSQHLVKKFPLQQNFGLPPLIHPTPYHYLENHVVRNQLKVAPLKLKPKKLKG